MPDMLQELLATTGTLDFKEEGGVRISSVRRPADSKDLEIDLTLTLYGDVLENERWRLRCHGELDSHVTPRWGDNLEISRDHVLLWPHRESLVSLWMERPGPDVAATIGALWLAHHGLLGEWFPFLHFIGRSCELRQLLSKGRGQLALGPWPIMERYKAILDEHGFKTHLTPRVPRFATAEETHAAANFQVLTMGNHYVVAAGFDARRAE